MVSETTRKSHPHMGGGEGLLFSTRERTQASVTVPDEVTRVTARIRLDYSEQSGLPSPYNFKCWRARKAPPSKQ